MSIERFKLAEATSGYSSDFDSKKQSKEWVLNVVEQDDLLPNISFDIPFNIVQYLHLRNTNMEGYLELTRRDVEGYVREFTMGDPIIPYEVSIGLSDNEPSVLTEHYVTHEIVPLLSLLDPRERGGAVCRRTELLGKLLFDANPGDSFLSTSPDGWHGMEDVGQTATEYNHTQTTLYKKLPQGKIEAYTVRSSMTLSQNEQLLMRASKGQYSPIEDAKNIKGRIIDVVDTVVMSPELNDVNDLVNAINILRDGSPFWVNRKYTGEIMKVWNANDAISLFNSRKLNPLNQELTPIFNKFKNRVRTNIQGDSIDEIRLLANYLKDLVLESSFAARSSTLPEGTQYNSQTEASYNEGLAGCVGSVYSEFGPRSVEEEYSFDKWDWCKCCSSDKTKVYKWVGPCQICEKCDNFLRSGIIPRKVEEPKETAPEVIRSTPYEETNLTNGVIQLISTLVGIN